MNLSRFVWRSFFSRLQSHAFSRSARLHRVRRLSQRAFGAVRQIELLEAKTVLSGASITNLAVTQDAAVNQEVTLTGDFTNVPNDDPLSVVVNWGDGTTETFDYVAGTDSFSETHRFDSDSSDQTGGEYEISVELIVGEFATVGNEVLVNTHTTGEQALSDMAIADDGSFVVVWNSRGQDAGGDAGIFAQRYAADGSTMGDEFQVNTTTTGDQAFARVAMAGDGRFAIVWQTPHPVSGDTEIVVRRYGADGATLGGEVTVNSTTSGDQGHADIAMASDGSFVVTWRSFGQDGSSYGIYGQRYNADGNRVGVEFLVNTETDGLQSQTSAAMADDGSFIITWMSNLQDGDSAGIYAQRYASNGDKLGVEFLVNTTTASGQYDPEVVIGPDGGFIITWESFTQDGEQYGIYAQRYAADGSTLGDEFQVNTNTAGTQESPTIGIAADGGFTIAWESFGPDGSLLSIQAQRYAADGTTLGDEFQVNTTTSNDQRNPSIAVGSDGDLVITWESDGQDGSDYGIYAQRFSAPQTYEAITTSVTVHPVALENLSVTSGAAVGDVVMLTGDIDYPPAGEPLTLVVDWGDGTTEEFEYSAGTTDFSETHIYTDDSLEETNEEFAVSVELIIGDRGVVGEAAVGSDASGQQSDPVIGVGPDGSYVVAWYDHGKDGSSFGISARRFDALGNPLGDDFRVNTYTDGAQDMQAVAVAEDGSFIIAWRSAQNPDDFRDTDIYAQRYAADGSTIGGEFRVNTDTANAQQYPSIAIFSDNSFLIAWNGEGTGGDNFGVYAQRFAADGSKVGGQFLVNTETESHQALPSIAVAEDDSFVVVWQSDAQDGDRRGIFGQRFAADGTTVGNEFQVNTYTAGHQALPDVEMAVDGSFVVTWRSDGQDGDDYGVYAQRFDADGLKAGDEFLVNTETAGYQGNGQIAMLEDGRFLITWISKDQDGDGLGVYARRFLADGTKDGEEFRVNESTEGHQQSPAVGVSADGTIVITWSSDPSDALPSIYSRRFPVLESLTDSTTVGINPPPTVQITSVTGDVTEGDTVTASGQFLYTPSDVPIKLTIDWGDGTVESFDYDAGTTTFSETHVYDENSYAEVGGAYDLTASIEIGQEVQVNTYTNSFQDTASLAVADDGSYVVVWNSKGQDGSDEGVYGQRFSASGAKIGAEFRVNTQTTGDQEGPVIAMQPGGQFIVSWFSRAGDEGVYAQRYDADANAIGSNFLVQSAPASFHIHPSIGTAADGSFVIAWYNTEIDGSGFGISAQRFDANGNKVGGEIAVNTHTASEQRKPVIAVAGDGSFIVAWESAGQDGDDTGVYAQRFDSDGVPVGTEFPVNTHTTGEQEGQEIAVASDGSFVIAWHSVDQDGSSGGIYARRYAANGTAVGDEFLVNTTTEGGQFSPSIAYDSQDNFVIAWSGATDAGDGSDLVAQRFAADGTRVGGEFVVNQLDSGSQQSPDIAFNPAGGLVATWSGVGTVDSQGVSTRVLEQTVGDSTSVAVAELVSTVTLDALPATIVEGSTVTATGQFENLPAGEPIKLTIDWGDGTVETFDYDAGTTSYSETHTYADDSGDGSFSIQVYLGEAGDNALSDEIEPSPLDTDATRSAANPNITTAPDGSFLLVWDNDFRDKIYGQRFAADGTELGDRFELESPVTGASHNNTRPEAGFAADGSFVVIWVGRDGSSFGLHAQRFAADGTKVGDEILVNTTTGADQTYPALAVGDDGTFAVTWSGWHSGDNRYDIYLQRFGADGNRVGDETIVNTYRSGSQFFPSLAMSNDGGLVVAWPSANPEVGDSLDIYFQRFDADGTAIGAEVLANSTTASNQNIPTIGMANDGSFIVTWTSDEQDGDEDGIYAQRFDADGTKIGDEFQVNTYTSGYQGDSSIAVTKGGQFLIAWTSWDQDGSQGGTFAQQFAADGSRVGTEFQVNTEGNGNQTLPTVAVTADGDFVIAWQDYTTPGVRIRTVPRMTGAVGFTTVTNAAPVVTITSIVTGENGLVTLSGTLSDAGTTDALKVTVDWGDGNTETFDYVAGTTTFTETHTYSTTDDTFRYTVSVSVADEDGGTNGPHQQDAVFENRAPSLTATPNTTLDYREGFSPVTLFDEVVITDPDDTELSQATVQVTDGYASGRDVLAASDSLPDGITASFDATTGTLTLSGNASIADCITALKSVTFWTAGGLEASTRTVTLTITDANSVGHEDGTKTATDTRLLSLTPQSINSVPFNGPAEQQWETAISDGAAGDPDPRMWDPSRTYIDTQVGTLDGTTVIYTRGAHSGIWYVSTLEDGQFTPEVAWGVWEGWKKDPNRWQDVIIGDVNGDGASDVLGLTRNNGLWLMTANSARDGFDEEIYLGQLLQRESWTDLNAADVNGDGRDDIVIRSQSGGGWWTLVRNDANDGFAAPAWQQEWDTTQTWVDVHAVDLDNDGNADLIGRSLESGEWVAMLAKADGTGFKNEQVIATWDSSHTYVDVTVQDVDGDGTVDLLARTKETGEWHVSTGLTNGRIFAVSAANTWASWDAAWQLKRPWINTTFGDYNGDGKLDLVTQARTGASWWMMLANDAGDGFNDAFTIDLFNPTEMWSHLTAVDVNGDLGTNSTPRMDLIGLASGRTGWWIAESDPSSTDAGTISAHASNTAFDRDANFETIGRGDFNGDGRVDLLAQEVDTGAWWVMLGGDTDSGFLAPQKWTTLGKGWQLARTWNRAVIGDINGDGRDDVLIDHDRGGLFVMVANGTGDGFEQERWVRNINRNIDELFLLDVNGDGRDDIASFDDTIDQWYYAAALTDSIGFERMTRSQMWVAPQWNNPRWDDFQVGDVNGDGRDDIIGRSKTANGMYVMLASTRINGFEDEQWVGRFPSDENLGTILVADVTGDGRDDIIAWSKTDGDWLVMASTDGTNLFEAPTTWATWTDWRVEQPWEVFLTGDVNRDGKMDIYSQAENGGWWLMLSTGTSFEAPRYMRHS